MRKDVREFIRRFQAEGLTVESTPGHYRVLRDGKPLRKANGMPFTLPFSPDTDGPLAQGSDRRAAQARDRAVARTREMPKPADLPVTGDSRAFRPECQRLARVRDCRDGGRERLRPVALLSPSRTPSLNPPSIRAR
jgi:hypothetical protein